MAAMVSQSPVSICHAVDILSVRHPAAWQGSESSLGEALSLVSRSLASYKSVETALDWLRGVSRQDMDLCRATLASHA